MAFRWPLNNFTITQGFGGNATYYRQFGQAGHNGIDLAAATGTPVFAADEGTVVFEGWGQNHPWMGRVAGICVIINHIGSHAGYAHLNSTVVNKGQKVTKGQLIGYVGATGTATGPHLHFEMLPLRPNFSNGYAGRINVTPYIENTSNATREQVAQAYREILEREADAAGLNHYINYPLDFVRADLNASTEKRQLEQRKAQAAADAARRAAEEAKKAADRKAAEEAAAKAQAELDRIAAEEAKAKADAESKAMSMAELEKLSSEVKENNRLLNILLELVKQIADKLTAVFK